MNLLRFALLMTVVFAFLWAFVPQALHAQAPAKPDTASSAAALASPSVDTKQYGFMPSTLTVTAGTTVVFKNSDDVPHTVTASDKSFDSGNMDHATTWSHVFSKPGTYAYLCAYHTYMHGTIVVK